MIPIIIMLFAWMIQIIADGQTLRVSAAWCYDNAYAKDFTCDMVMFIMVVLVDTAMFVLFVSIFRLLFSLYNRICSCQYNGTNICATYEMARIFGTLYKQNFLQNFILKSDKFRQKRKKILRNFRSYCC